MHAWTHEPFVPSHAVCSNQAEFGQITRIHSLYIYTACACPITYSCALRGPLHINSLHLHSWVIQTTQFQIISDLPTLPQRHTMLARGTGSACVHIYMSLWSRELSRFSCTRIITCRRASTLGGEGKKCFSQSSAACWRCAQSPGRTHLDQQEVEIRAWWQFDGSRPLPRRVGLLPFWWTA